jgi:hypothetical protein
MHGGKLGEGGRHTKSTKPRCSATRDCTHHAQPTLAQGHRHHLPRHGLRRNLLFRDAERSRSFDHNPDREKPRPGASSPCTAQHTGTRPTARRDRHRLHYRGRERNRRRRSQHRAHARESRGRGRGHRRAPAEAGPTRLWGSGPPGSRRRLLLPLGGTVGQRLSASHFWPHWELADKRFQGGRGGLSGAICSALTTWQRSQPGWEGTDPHSAHHGEAAERPSAPGA